MYYKEIMDCRRVGLIGFTLVLAAASLLHSTTAETYTVLDAAGWRIPDAGNDAVYRAWTLNKEFEVGDILVFTFVTDAHDVTKVTKANYDSCGTENPISKLTTGPANVNLTTPGMHYFICTFGTHCQNGQRLAVNVTADDDSNTRTPPATPSPPGTRTPTATPPSTSTTPPATTTTSPPPPSSASSITFGGCFSVAILSIVLVFLH